MVNETREPLYLQIKEYFKELITSKKLSAHDRIPTEREIMEKFDVSRITVTNALSELVKEGWIYRIAGKGSFVEDGVENLFDSVANLDDKDFKTHLMDSSTSSNPKRKVIGLIMPTIEDFFAVRLINGIYGVLLNTEYTVSIILTHNSKEKEQEAIREFLRMQVAGLLIFPIDAETYNEDLLELKVRNFPFVLIDRYLPGVETNYVSSDNTMGAKLAVSHLWDLGHRNIVICADSPGTTVSVEDRIKGYMDALTEKEAMINPSFIVTDFKVSGSSNENVLPLQQLIENKVATAFIALNAKLGLHLYKLAKSMKLRVPEDISIISFDDPYFDSDLGDFTHIYQFEQRIGEEAANILNQLLTNQRKNEGYKKINIAPKLVVKGTTGSAPK
ncbi:GntR family transcriptional regulator [Bacillus niameyensis]|uniref:GntR family transcriptional regulator n=1 Tax=Bacillus niameyensis TaxID=1522308 RepID=UPI000782C5A9|nr:GntR family transcriptional regulator [Bacillus niameyensis]